MGTTRGLGPSVPAAQPCSAVLVVRINLDMLLFMIVTAEFIQSNDLNFLERPQFMMCGSSHAVM